MRGLRPAVSRHHVLVVGERAMCDDDNARRRIAQRPADARLQQMVAAGCVDHRNPMDLFPPGTLRAGDGTRCRLGLSPTIHRHKQNKARSKDREKTARDLRRVLFRTNLALVVVNWRCCHCSGSSVDRRAFRRIARGRPPDVGHMAALRLPKADRDGFEAALKSPLDDVDF